MVGIVRDRQNQWIGHLPADVLDANAEINLALLEIRRQLREAHASASYGTWEARLPFTPNKFSDLESGNRYRLRLQLGKNPR